MSAGSGDIQGDSQDMARAVEDLAAHWDGRGSAPGLPGCFLALAGFAAMAGILFLYLISSGFPLGGGQRTAETRAVGSTTEPTVDIYNSGGELIPIPGIWDISNGEGVVTCFDDTNLAAHLQRAELEVSAGGETITVTPLTPEGRGEPIVLERDEATERYALYSVDLSERTGVDDFEMWLDFSSSSTVGGRMEGCPERGGQGWLVEAFER